MKATEEEVSLPALPIRLMNVLFSPGRLMEQLAERPAWAGAMLVSAILVGAGIALIPAELIMEANRQAAIERGGEFPEMSERALQALRIVIR